MKTESVELRVQVDEKEAFKRAAEIAGIPLSAWIRERCRRAARTELEEVGEQIPFIQSRRGTVR